MQDQQADTDWKRIAHFLFGVLDDIDAFGDVARGDNARYRQLVERCHKRRFEVAQVVDDEVVFKLRPLIQSP